jgi:glucan phosphoethanolaminetransferase (alkaline phosphatase superfamily)
MTAMNRHTLYYRLMDFSALGLLLSFGVSAAMNVTGRDLVPEMVQPVFTVIGLLSLVIPALLIFQRWMRDDFSEMLWQRTAGTVLKLLITLPIPIAVGWAVWIANQDPEALNTLAHRIDPSQPVVFALLQGVIQSAVYLWIATPVLFTAVFQWHRWRASR